MSVLRSYGNGVKRAFLEIKMVTVLWLVNFMSASVIYFMVSKYLGDKIGNRLVASNFLEKFDFMTFFELLTHEGQGLSWILYTALILAFMYYWVSLFLHGGILFVLKSRGLIGSAENGKMRFAPMFFQGAGKLFGRFFRLTIYSLLLWVSFGAFYFILNLVLKPLEAGGTNEQAMFYLFWVRAGIILFFYFLIRMIGDYARIQIVVEDSRAVFKSLIQAIGFVFRNLIKTLLLYYSMLITGAVIFGVYWIVQKMVPTQTLLPILIAFLIGQIFILSRGWLKIALQAAQLHFFTFKK